MKNRTRLHEGRGRRPLPRALLGALALSAPLAACDTQKLLNVEDPAFATPGVLGDAAGVPTLVAGAVADFQGAYSGPGGDAFLSVSSLISDELYDTDTFDTRISTDQRSQFPAGQANTSDFAFNALEAARRSLSEAADAVEKNAGAKDPRIAELRALEGMTYVALGEGFCAPIPFSASKGGAPGEFGQPLAQNQVFQEAVKRFDMALAADPNNNLAKIGKGRALLNLGDFAGAAAAVAGVPTVYAYKIEHSANSGRQQNPIYGLQQNGRYSMSDNEGINGLPYRSAKDPRLPWITKGLGFDKVNTVYLDQRYPGFGANVPLATGVEARLIEAEALLNKGASGAYVAKLNDLRKDVYTLMSGLFTDYQKQVPGPNNPTTTLDPLTDPGSAQARVDQFFKERAYWLFTTAHRQGDLRRLVRQYGRTQDKVFPTGKFHKGGVYGNDVAFPIPFNEQNNPNYKLDQCNRQQA